MFNVCYLNHGLEWYCECQTIHLKQCLTNLFYGCRQLIRPSEPLYRRIRPLRFNVKTWLFLSRENPANRLIMHPHKHYLLPNKKTPALRFAVNSKPVGLSLFQNLGQDCWTCKRRITWAVKCVMTVDRNRCVTFYNQWSIYTVSQKTSLIFSTVTLKIIIRFW